MTQKATVIRHVRPTDDHGETKAKGGFTFVFDLDYTDRSLTVRLSSCSKNDNFNKKEGIKYAKAAEPIARLNLDSFQKVANQPDVSGFTTAIITYIRTMDAFGGSSKAESEFVRRYNKFCG